MKSLSGKELARLVEQQGWNCSRIKGSHHIYVKPGSELRLVIPIHGSQSLKRGLQAHIMKLAGLSDDDL